jgi:prepilin-type N-terminal cleavage/methylation domain-containing protein
MPLPSRRARGYSLLELMTVIVVIGIVLAFAVPSIERTLQLIRARGALNQVSGAIFRTRMEAVREGRTVELVLSSDPELCLRGYVVRPRGDPVPRPRVDLARDLRGLCLRHGRSPRDSVIGFNSRGMLKGNNASFWYTDPGIPDRLVISIAGRVRREP